MIYSIIFLLDTNRIRVLKEGQLVDRNPSDHGGFTLAKGVRQSYAEGQTDYSLDPLVLCDSDNRPIGRIRDGDGIIFCCRRGEREI